MPYVDKVKSVKKTRGFPNQGFHLLLENEWNALSEWLLFKAVFFQLYHGENKLHFNEMMMSPLYWTNMHSWIFIVLTHWNNRSICRFIPRSTTIEVSPSTITRLMWFLIFNLTRLHGDLCCLMPLSYQQKYLYKFLLRKLFLLLTTLIISCHLKKELEAQSTEPVSLTWQ